jgi:hypothetical protein
MDINSTKQILGDLAKPLIISAVMLGISTALFSSSIIYFEQLKNQHESSQEAYRTVKKVFFATKVELESARKYAESFQLLNDSNATGDFAKQRALDYLEWALSENIVIPKSYSLAARQTLSSTDFIGLDKHEVSKHTVNMEMQLPHELRLLAFIEKITEPNPGGITTVEACEITISKNDGKESTSASSSVPSAVPLHSRCQLNWYRFGEKTMVANNGMLAPKIPSTPLTATTFGSPSGKK